MEMAATCNYETNAVGKYQRMAHSVMEDRRR